MRNSWWQLFHRGPAGFNLRAKIHAALGEDIIFQDAQRRVTRQINVRRKLPRVSAEQIILGNTGAVEPFAKTLAAKKEATVFVCVGNACQLPTSDAAKVKELLK